MTKDEAIKQVFKELDALSPEQFRKTLDEHKSGDFALALKELGEFLAQQEILYRGGENG